MGAYLSDDNTLWVSYACEHVDLIWVIHKLKLELPIKVKFVHIYGHQDCTQALTSLSQLEQLNVWVDCMAKQHLDKLYLQDISAGGLPPCCSDLEGEGWSIYLNETKLTGDPSMAIQNFTLGRQYSKYLADKGLLTLVAFDLVNWQAMAKTADSFPILYHLWAAKHTSGWCTVGQRML
jgi:hypothetical protein